MSEKRALHPADDNSADDSAAPISALAQYFYADEAACVQDMLDYLPWDEARRQRVSGSARDLVTRVRGARRKTGELESFLQQYGLNSDEGLALMTLAEALLRIPDPHTANLLIRDKIVAVDWLKKQGDSKDLMVKAAGLGLSITRKALDSAASKLGEGVIRSAIVQAMRMMGRQFVLGRSIEEGIKNARDYEKKGYYLSYDMLGEGARTMDDAERYFQAYYDALGQIAASAGPAPDVTRRPGISVKLSALHPRYEYHHHEECVPALTEKLTALARLAAQHNIALSVDAEEADRLALSLEIIGAVARDPALKDWDGLGIVIQAYQKRCFALIDHLAAMAASSGRRLQVRLVKGAYWDTEIKRAQLMGLADYPVYSRKANTDLSFIACAEKLLAYGDVFYPMLATHNAQSVAAIADLARESGRGHGTFEFQRLHGMGETLHDLAIKDGIAPVRVYAPCGSHEDLLPYLVRRLLENGANSSFVNLLLDAQTPVETLIADPVADAAAHETKRHPHIPLPRAIYGQGRINSAGLDLTEKTVIEPLFEAMAEKTADKMFEATPLIAGRHIAQGQQIDVINPARTSDVVGTMWQAGDDLIARAFDTAKEGFAKWSAVPAKDRAAALERLGDLMEEHSAELMGVCMREGGKTVDDALAEIREAVDFCRYYAQRGRIDFDDEGTLLPGPTGERNVLRLHGRGIFICISPWNFPLAIFTGQIMAALMAGNAVIAKPAEQTPIIASRLAQLALEAGIMPEALTLLPGDGRLGAALIAHPDVAGVAFTGSVEVARLINRSLAEKDGPIVPLIAETGGQNAMIVDSSALPEQVIDDVIISAFGSAGQRCSAMRILCLQEDVADKMIAMLKGALAAQKLGDPFDISTDIGPIIDEEALQKLEDYRDHLDKTARFIAAAPLPDNLAGQGHFFAPVAYEIDDISQLGEEVFGPVLHVVRYKAEDLDTLIDKINATGYGLTFGVHSRISSVTAHMARRVNVGNVYVNRTMIGAVVGVQPFGGNGLSGTGPKAGGPHYLPRFANEKVVSTDTARIGGNAGLVSLEE